MKNLMLDDFTRYKFLSNLDLSPDGKFAFFAMHESNVDENKYDSNLFLYNLEEKRSQKFTSFNKERSYIFLESGEDIMFSSIRDNKDKEKIEKGESFTQFYKMNIHGGEAQKFFSIAMNVNQIEQLNKDKFIFTASYNPMENDMENLNFEEKDKELKRRKEAEDYEVIDEIPFWTNGGSFTNKIRSRMYIYDINTKKSEAITSELMNVENFNLNSDKSKVIFHAESFKDVMSLNNEIYIYDIENETLDNILLQNKFAVSYADFMNDDTIIFMGSDMKKYGMNENNKFFKIDLNTKEIVCITPNLDKSTWNSVGSDCRYGGGKSVKKDGEYLYFITTEVDSSYINRVDINGNIEKLTKDRGSVDSYAVRDGKILLIAMRDLKLQELYSLQDKNENQLTDFNGWVNKERNIVKLHELKFETEPQVMIDGWVLKPVDFDENKKYPAILDIHGGPKTVYGSVFYHEMQYWANEGYFVFFCNPRGSDGRGNEFADIRGKYGTIDYDDIMKFTDEVLKKYENIDKDRVCVTGGSYGGFMTNWIIGHTDRFKAAASQRSISNWVTEFAATDIGYYFVEDQQACTPWNNIEKMWWHSPLKYADKAKTPTLFIHSNEDYRCWMAEALQMFTALKFNGVESRICLFKGENHELSRSGKPKHRTRRLKEITDWFNEHK